MDFILYLYVLASVFVLLVLVTESRASFIEAKCSTTELHYQLQCFYFLREELTNYPPYTYNFSEAVPSLELDFS